jgi:hypothetical protein
LKLVYSTANTLLVNHVRNLLEVAGIEVQMKNQYLGGGAGELPPTEAWPELWVDEVDVSRAQKVVDEFESGGSWSPSWRCPHCGEIVEGQFSVCWNCGTPRPEN